MENKTFFKYIRGELALPKSSTLLFMVTCLFLLFSFVSYTLFYKNLNDNYIKNQEITFYKIQKSTNNLLSKLLYSYQEEKKLLLEKHKVVLDYFKDKSYDINLEEIYKIINQNNENKPYNIYITDEKFIIKNTTYKPDLDFDLSFAKDIFFEHKKNNEIGVSYPIFEFYSSKFFSYTDSFLPNSNKILQVSYTYTNLDEDLENLQTLLKNSLDIKSSDAFVVYDDGFIGDFIFKQVDFKAIDERALKGKILEQYLDENEYLTKYQDGNNLKISYISEKSPIFDDIKIIYSIIFDESDLQNSIFKLNLIILFLTFIGLITIFIIYKVRQKEHILNYKDRFIEHSVHEIKTPLSIINLNIQLRDKIYGSDKYSKKIDGALKTLKNSYEDMTFLHTKDKIEYKVEKINIKEVLINRVKYFEIIAQTQTRNIELENIEDCFISISKIELSRLIDNNLSNAIKYSFVNSSIKVTLKNANLEFKLLGKEIRNPQNIFERYRRENEDTGGHGLGLSIVKDICLKYDIKIDVISQNSENNFKYSFNCHKFDTNNL